MKASQLISFSVYPKHGKLMADLLPNSLPLHILYKSCIHPGVICSCILSFSIARLAEPSCSIYGAVFGHPCNAGQLFRQDTIISTVAEGRKEWSWLITGLHSNESDVNFLISVVLSSVVLHKLVILRAFFISNIQRLQLMYILTLNFMKVSTECLLPLYK